MYGFDDIFYFGVSLVFDLYVKFLIGIDIGFLYDLINDLLGSLYLILRCALVLEEYFRDMLMCLA